MVVIKVAEGNYLFPRRVRRNGPDSAVVVGGNSEVVEIAGPDVAAMLAGLEAAAVKPNSVSWRACVTEIESEVVVQVPKTETPFVGELPGY